MIPQTVRADMHCHSTASRAGEARDPAQRRAARVRHASGGGLRTREGQGDGLRDDHGPRHDRRLPRARRPSDVFVSEELTTWFADEPQAVHVLCYGITPEDHEFLQAHARDLETCAAYLHEHDITCALAHPFFHVAAPLTARHRRRLAQLFPVWEVRNGSRARELNMPAAVYIETHGGTGIGGSDDHAGVDIGRTYTETAPASSPEQFLEHIRVGHAESAGSQGSAANGRIRRSRWPLAHSSAAGPGSTGSGRIVRLPCWRSPSGS